VFLDTFNDAFVVAIQTEGMVEIVGRGAMKLMHLHQKSKDGKQSIPFCSIGCNVKAKGWTSTADEAPALRVAQNPSEGGFLCFMNRSITGAYTVLSTEELPHFWFGHEKGEVLKQVPLPRIHSWQGCCEARWCWSGWIGWEGMESAKLPSHWPIDH